MKKIIFALLLLPQVLFASDLFLNAGESVLIQPNTTTRVTCQGNVNQNPSCSDSIAFLQNNYNYCKQSYTGSTCFADFQKEKQNILNVNPSCRMQIVPFCQKICSESYTDSTCFQNCK